MLLHAFFGSTSFANLPRYKGEKGRSPSKVFLVVPHANEFGPAIQFQRALSAELNKNGIQTELHKLSDTMKRGWRLRRVLVESKLQFEASTIILSDIIGSTLALTDSYVRAKLFFELLSSYENAVLLEIHATQGDFSDNQKFMHRENFVRLTDKKIIIVEDKINRLINAVRNTELYATIYSRDIERIAKLLGIDLNVSVIGTKSFLEKLENFKNNFMAIELPGGEPVKIPVSHPIMHFYNHKYEGDTISSFEYSYCLTYLKKRTFSQDDIIAVSSILVL